MTLHTDPAQCVDDDFCFLPENEELYLCHAYGHLKLKGSKHLFLYIAPAKSLEEAQKRIDASQGWKKDLNTKPINTPDDELEDDTEDTDYYRFRSDYY